MAKSARITKQMKHSIMNKAMAWKFGKVEADHKAFENRTAEAVFNDLFPPKIQQMFDKMPDWMLDPEACRIELDGPIKQLIDPEEALDLGYRHADVYLNFAEGAAKRMTLMPFGNTIRKEAFPSITPTSLEMLTKFLVEKYALEDRKGSFRKKLDGLLSQVGTTGKLVEIMPEAAEWLPEVYHCSNIPQADTVADLLKI